MTTITTVKSPLRIETITSQDNNFILTTNTNEKSGTSLKDTIQNSICSKCGSKENLKDEFLEGDNIIHLTRREIQLLRQSWAIMLLDLPEKASIRFYDVLKHKDKMAVCLLFDENTNVLPENEIDEADHCDCLSRDQTLLNTITSARYEDSLFSTEFYENLIALQKEKHGKFTSIRDQAASFGQIVNESIQNIDHLEKFNKRLQTISKRHVRIWSSSTEQFNMMGDTLLNTLEDRFGSLFTSELEDCWIKLFTHILNSFSMYKDDPTVFTVAAMKENRHWRDFNVFSGIAGVDYLEFPIPRYLDEEEEETFDENSNNYVYFNFMPRSKTNKNKPIPIEDSKPRKHAKVYNIKTGMIESTSDNSLAYDIFDKAPIREVTTLESTSNCGSIQGMSKHRDCVIM